VTSVNLGDSQGYEMSYTAAKIKPLQGTLSPQTFPSKLHHNKQN